MNKDLLRMFSHIVCPNVFTCLQTLSVHDMYNIFSVSWCFHRYETHQRTLNSGLQLQVFSSSARQWYTSQLFPEHVSTNIVVLKLTIVYSYLCSHGNSTAFALFS